MNNQTPSIMKIYIVRIEEVTDNVIWYHDLEAFGKEDDAWKRFKELVANAKNDDWDGWNIHESIDSFEAWTDGPGERQCYDIYLEEVEVK